MVDVDKRQRCAECDANLKSTDELVEHAEQEHAPLFQRNYLKRARRWGCDLATCNAFFATKDLYYAHIRDRHRVGIVPAFCGLYDPPSPSEVILRYGAGQEDEKNKEEKRNDRGDKDAVDPKHLRDLRLVKSSTIQDALHWVAPSWQSAFVTRQLPALGISKQVYVSWERLQLISQVGWDAASLRDGEVTESQLRDAYKGKFTGGTVEDVTKAYVDVVVDVAFAGPADEDAITVEDVADMILERDVHSSYHTFAQALKDGESPLQRTEAIQWPKFLKQRARGHAKGEDHDEEAADFIAQGASLRAALKTALRDTTREQVHAGLAKKYGVNVLRAFLHGTHAYDFKPFAFSCWRAITGDRIYAILTDVLRRIDYGDGLLRGRDAAQRGRPTRINASRPEGTRM